jgi:catechol 2,3-dioxygenase-like lactoylglutathione lyase family enzyme
MAPGFDHITLAVTDLDAAKRFLSVLGFAEDKAVSVHGDEMSAYMGIPDWEAEHVTLVLQGVPVRQEIQLLRFARPDLEIDSGSGVLSRSGFNHICFRTDDLDGTLERFAAIGVAPRNRIMAFHDRRLVFVTGPEGVVFELAEWAIGPEAPRP